MVLRKTFSCYLGAFHFVPFLPESLSYPREITETSQQKRRSVFNGENSTAANQFEETASMEIEH